MLGPEYKGVQTIVLLIYSLVLPVFTFGVTGGVRYFLAQEFELKETLVSIVGIGFFYFLVNVGVLHALEWLNLLNLEILTISGLFYLTIIGLFFYSFNNLFTRILLSLSQFVSYNRILLAYRCSYFLMIGLVYFFYSVKIKGVILAMVTSEGLHFCLLLYKILSKVKWRWRIDLVFIKKVHRYGIKVWLSEVLRISNRRLDQFVLASLLPAAALGIYAVGVTISELVQRIPQKIIPIFYNSVALEAAEDQKKKLLARVHRVVVWLTCLSALPLVLVGFWLISWLYGHHFSGAYYVLICYLPGTVVYMGTRVMLQYFSASAQLNNMSYIQLVGIGVGLPLYYFLIPIYGVIGAALSSSVAYLLTNVVGFLLLADLRFSDMYLPRKSDWHHLRKLLKV